MIQSQVFLGYNFIIMRKKIAIAAVAALFAVIALTAQPNQAPGGKQPSANQGQTPVILPTPEKQNHSADDQTKTDSNAPTPHAPFHDPNWMVVAYGYVKYRDIFGRERESRSCDFTCIGRSDNIPMEFIPHLKVPAAYNRCT